MFRSVAYGFLIGLIIAGAAWFVVGRNNTTENRSAFDRVNSDLERVHGAVSELRTEADGFTKSISDIDRGLDQSKDRSIGIVSRVGSINDQVRGLATEVDQLEQWNKRSIQLSRDLADVAAELRRVNKEN